jgi:hypothetical protein
MADSLQAPVGADGGAAAGTVPTASPDPAPGPAATAGQPPAAAPGQWRARLQQMTPAQRRQLIDRWRARQAATARPH